MIEWRYGDQLDWRLVVIGLSEDTTRYDAHGYTPGRMARSHVRFRDRYGMPFAGGVKARLSPSSRACRAIVAARLQAPGSEWRVLRELQLANFNTPLLFDDDDAMRAVLGGVPGVDADAVLEALDSPAVLEAYAADKALTRTAEGSATELQGKAANSDGAVRYTAPSVWFENRDGLRLEAGGFQPVEAYDVLIANLDPELKRRDPPEDPSTLLRRFELGLTTQEVAALMTSGNDAPDRAAAERALLALVDDGRAARRAVGDDALWLSAEALQPIAGDSDAAPARAGAWARG